MIMYDKLKFFLNIFYAGIKHSFTIELPPNWHAPLTRSGFIVDEEKITNIGEHLYEALNALAQELDQRKP